MTELYEFMGLKYKSSLVAMSAETIIKCGNYEYFF